MSVFDLSDIGEKIADMVDNNCPYDLKSGPASQWDNDIREAILDRVDLVDIEDAEDLSSRLEDWTGELDRGDLLDYVYPEIVYSADCEEFYRTHEDECEEAIGEMYGTIEDFVSAVSPSSLTALIDSAANAGIYHLVETLAHEWVDDLTSEVEDLIAEVQEAIMLADLED